METIHDLDAALARSEASPGPASGLDRRALEATLRTTLAAFDKEAAAKQSRSSRNRGPRRARDVSRQAPPAPGIDRRFAWLARGIDRRVAWLCISVIVIASAVGTTLLAMRSEQPSPVVGVAASAPPATLAPPSPPLELTDAERSALDTALAIAEDLDRSVVAGVPFRVYFNRASAAHAEAGRHLDEVKDVAPRRLLQQALMLHRLAARAWRARTLNEQDAWERIGADPTAEVCAPVRRALDSGDDPRGMPRGEWRGIVIAATLPLVWDCAADRVTEARRMLAAR
jgi:hypothetical protein